jgi:acetylornithine deacetylase/succinyl-diaminopimelate desuccinylase-like protein
LVNCRPSLVFRPRQSPGHEFRFSGATAHMVNEHVAVAEIEALMEIYAAILEVNFG